MKDLDNFIFEESVVSENQIRALYDGSFIEERTNLIFVGGTGTGKTHLSIAIAAHAVRTGDRAKFYNLVDLANLLEREKMEGNGGKLAAMLSRFIWLCLTNWDICLFLKTGASFSSIRYLNCMS